MDNEERLDLLDHARRCDVLAEENARLRKRLEELSLAFEATVGAFRQLARDLGATCCDGSGRRGHVDPVVDGRLSVSGRRAVAAEAGVDDRTLNSALSGGRLWPQTREAISAALKRRGLAHLLPSSEATRAQERTTDK